MYNSRARTGLLHAQRRIVVIRACVAAARHGRAGNTAGTWGCIGLRMAVNRTVLSRHTAAATQVRTCPPATMWSSFPGQLGLVRLRRATHSLRLPSGCRT